MANSLHLDEDNHNPGAQNIEIIERVRLKGHQNHFILECGGELRIERRDETKPFRVTT